MRLKTWIILLGAGLAACSANPQRAQTEVPVETAPVEKSDDGTQAKPVASEPETTQNLAQVNLNATLYIQTATEYDAHAQTVYQAAAANLDAALKDRTWTAATEQGVGYEGKPPAIILDVDETVLDNSPYQARLLQDGAFFSTESWNTWAAEGQATAVPGAVEFLNLAAAKGVRIFYVTNRDHSVEDGTRRNLQNLGFPLPEGAGDDFLLTKKERPEWGSDKTPRRQLVAANYRIIMLFGDNLGDFIGNAKGSPTERDANAAVYRDFWGSKWFMLANPMYGYWEGALYDFEYGASDAAKNRRKTKHLDPKR